MHLEIKQGTDRTETVNSEIIDKLYRLAFEDIPNGITSQLDATSDLQGRIESSAAYEDAVTYLNAKFPNLTIVVPNNNYYVRFVDSAARLICVFNWGDSIGVTRNALANVLRYGYVFWNNTTIVNFPELLYFTGITDFASLFYYNSGATCALKRITFPSITVNYSDVIFRGLGWNGSGYNLIELEHIDWNGCHLNYTGSTAYGYPPVFRNCRIQYYDGLIPNLSTLPMLFITVKDLGKVIYPEGVLVTNDNFNGCAVSYIEFPTTLTQANDVFSANFRRDAGNFGISNNSGCVVFKSVVPPTTTVTWSSNPSYPRYPAKIYVPDGSVQAYKTAWTDSSGKILDLITPMSQMTTAEREMGTVTQEDIDRT